jgi:hypothetical protein
MAREYYGISEMPEEYTLPASEFSGIKTSYEYDRTSMGGPPSATKPVSAEKKSKSHEMLKKMLLAPVLGVVTVLMVVSSAVGTDLIAEYFGDTLGSVGTVFPVLPNLEPNGYVSFMNYGILDEEYVLLQSRDYEYTYLWSGTARGMETAEVEGAVYDRDSNTLTLTDFDGSDVVLEINMMGNGFTLKLEGENRLQGILAWGFHYGGSIKVTGSGSLFVNENGEREVGIQFEAETSESCLMVDSGVAMLTSRGAYAAFMVSESTHSRGMYVASTLRLNGGQGGEFKSEPVSDEYYDEYYYEEFEHEHEHVPTHIFTVFGDDGEPSQFIYIAPPGSVPPGEELP